MGSVFQRRHKVHVSIQQHQKRMAKARALVALRVLQQVHSRLLAMSRFPQEYDLVADQRGAIMLAAPLGEQRMVGMADSDMTRESSSWGTTWPMTCSI